MTSLKKLQKQAEEKLFDSIYGLDKENRKKAIDRRINSSIKKSATKAEKKLAQKKLEEELRRFQNTTIPENQETTK